MSLDIFNPEVSVVSHDMEGKTILVYGSNRTGKTKVGTQLPKPFYLAFEKGINGVAGIPFANINSWSDFKKVNKQLTNPKTIDQVKEMYSTILFDTVNMSALYCQDYLCDMYGVNTIAEGRGGYGLWREYEVEYWREINKLTGAGFTVYFIAHDSTRDFKDEAGETYTKIFPEGDKRSIDPICNLVDVIAYLKPNGLDESGNEIKSSAFFTQTKQYHAGSRFDYLQPFLKEFSAENLQKAIADAVSKQEKADGVKSVGYEEFKQTYTETKVSFEDLKSMIGKQAKWCKDNDKIVKYQEVVGNYLGNGAKVSEATPKQYQQLEMILRFRRFRSF